VSAMPAPAAADPLPARPGETSGARRRPALTADQLQLLPPVVDVPTAAAVLGIGRTAAYELVRCGRWPTPVLRLGKLIRVPTAPLLDLVGLGR
jgi:predicted DNA-binding transcriptional regulator AlpA